MPQGSTIVSVRARQIFSNRGHPGIQVTVTTENGAIGVAEVTAGVSVGKHEVKFAYDGGDRWKGRGVMRAVQNVHEIIAPAVIGMDATQQGVVDQAIIDLDGTPDKSRLGGNATAAVSAAVLKAGANSLGIPLYQHIGGVNACLLPVPGVLTVLGSRRYGGGQRSGGKPSYSVMCYGFDSFADASYAAYEILETFRELIWDQLQIDSTSVRTPVVSPGCVKEDRELWDLMTEAIQRSGYEGRAGIQVDVAAATYYDAERARYVGLFSPEDKTREELMRLYQDAVRNYPFVIIEDPLDEEDLEGHAILTRELGIEIVGDDLFTTNPERVRRGIEAGATNCVLLKVNQIGTISEAFEMVRLAYAHGYGVMPCDSRGEGPAIADYTVGLGCGHLREGGIGPNANRFLEIEAELGSRAVFAGRKGLKP